MNCENCPTHCCGMQNVTPILMPHEVKEFAPEDLMADGELFRLRRLLYTNCCVFLDMATHRCTIYERRPLECRLYPYIMHWNAQAKMLEFQLHSGCPQREEAPLPAKVLAEYQKLVGIGEDFWLKFEEAAP